MIGATAATAIHAAETAISAYPATALILACALWIGCAIAGVAMGVFADRLYQQHNKDEP